MNRIPDKFAFWRWPRIIDRLTTELKELRDEHAKVLAGQSKLLDWVKTTHRLDSPAEGIRALIQNGKRLVPLLVLLLGVQMAAAQAPPVLRQPLTTNSHFGPVPTEGQVPIWNATANKWSNNIISGGGVAFADLVWTNKSGTLVPVAFPTNILFRVVAPDDGIATNFYFDSRTFRTNAATKLFAIYNGGSNAVTVGPNGGLFMGRGNQTPFPGVVLYGIYDTSIGESNQQEIFIQSKSSAVGYNGSADMIVDTNYGAFVLTAVKEGGTRFSRFAIQAGGGIDPEKFNNFNMQALVDGATYFQIDPSFTLLTPTNYLFSSSVRVTNTHTLMSLQNSNTPVLEVDGVGDLRMIKRVPYKWPSVQGAASTALTNDGAGNLGWGTVSSGVSTPHIWTNDVGIIHPVSTNAFYVYPWGGVVGGSNTIAANGAPLTPDYSFLSYHVGPNDSSPNIISLNSISDIGFGGGGEITLTTLTNGSSTMAMNGFNQFGSYQVLLGAAVAGNASVLIVKGANAGEDFRVTNGNISVVRSINYLWPSAQGAASTALTNDGSGNLGWWPITVSGGSGLSTNANQFLGVPLSIKDGAFLTNVNVQSSLEVSNGWIYASGPVTNGTQLNLPHLTVSRSAVINAQGDVTNSSADSNWSLYPTNVWNDRQFGSQNLTNWSNIPTGAMANVVSTTFLTNWANAISNYVTAATNSASVTNWITTRQPASANLTNWSNIPTGAMANVVAVDYLTNWANAISNYANTKQHGTLILTNLSGTGAITNYADLVWTNNVGAIYTVVDRPRIEFTTNRIFGRLIRADGTNTALGSNAAMPGFGGEKNTAVGTEALSVSGGTENTAMGHRAAISNSSGSFNVAIGSAAMEFSQFRSDNTAVGYNSMHTLSVGGQNTAIGSSTMDILTSSTDGTALGWGALDKMEGSGNTALGSQALLNAQGGGNYNVAIGYESMEASDRLEGNVAIGRGALAGIDDLTNMVVIGYQATALSGGKTNAVGIGALTRITADNQMMLGTNIINYVFRNVGYNFPSAQGSAATILTNDGAGNLGWGTDNSGTGGDSMWSSNSGYTYLTSYPTNVIFNPSNNGAGPSPTSPTLTNFSFRTDKRRTGGTNQIFTIFNGDRSAMVVGDGGIMLGMSNWITVPQEAIDMSYDTVFGDHYDKSVTLTVINSDVGFSGTTEWTATTNSAKMILTANKEGNGFIAFSETVGLGAWTNFDLRLLVQDAANTFITPYQIDPDFSLSPTGYIFGTTLRTTNTQMILSLQNSNFPVFEVDGVGDIRKIKKIAYLWPGSQGSQGTALTNDGSGNLGWGFFQSASANLTNWSNIPTGAMANVVATDYLTNWANAISNLAQTKAITNTPIVAVGNLHVTNQLLRVNEHVNGGTVFTNLDFTGSIIKTMTNAITGSRTNNLTNAVGGASMILYVVGSDGAVSATDFNYTFTAASANIRWMNSPTNGNAIDVLIHSNQVYTFRFDVVTNATGPATNIIASWSTDSNRPILNKPIAISAGAGTSNAWLEGRVFLDATTQTTNHTGTANYTNLFTFTVPANTLTNLNDEIEFYLSGHFRFLTATTNSLKCIYGTATIFETGFITASNCPWKAAIRITRTGNSTQRIESEVRWNVNAAIGSFGNGTLSTFATNMPFAQVNGVTNIFAFQGESRIPAAITNDYRLVRWNPGPRGNVP